MIYKVSGKAIQVFKISFLAIIFILSILTFYNLSQQPQTVTRIESTGLSDKEKFDSVTIGMSFEEVKQTLVGIDIIPAESAPSDEYQCCIYIDDKVEIGHLVFDDGHLISKRLTEISV